MPVNPSGSFGSGGGDIDAIESRLSVVENDLIIVEADIGDLEDTVVVLAAADTALDGRLDTAEAALVTLDGRLDLAEPAITALQAADISLDSRLDVLEALATNLPRVLASVSLGAAASSLDTGTFPAHTNGYLLDIYAVTKTQTGGGIGSAGLTLRCNGRSDNIYAWQIEQSVDTTAAALESGGGTNAWPAADIGDNDPLRWTVSHWRVFNYLGTHKSMLGESYFAGGYTTQQLRLIGGHFNNNSPISSCSIQHSAGSNLIAGTRLWVTSTALT